jgi:hypothetical protein
VSQRERERERFGTETKVEGASKGARDWTGERAKERDGVRTVENERVFDESNSHQDPRSPGFSLGAD